MESMTSFKGYGKVDEHEEQFRHNQRKRLITIAISLAVLAIIVGTVVGAVVHSRSNDSSSSPNSNPATTPGLTPSANLNSVCGVTNYPTSCITSISSLKGSNTTDPPALFKLSLQVAIAELVKLKRLPASKVKAVNETALKVCEAVLDDAVDMLNDSLSAMEVDDKLSPAMIHDLATWISASMTNQETCLDSLAEINSTLLQEFSSTMQNSTQYTSNSLAIVVKLLSILSRVNIPGQRRRLLGFPEWVGPGDRRLLQQNVTEAHVTVAKDGTGDFEMIQEAVDVVPKKNSTRFVIHVKQGTYLENVNIDKSKWNIMMYGDGKDKTIVSGSLNYVDGTATFLTPTFAVAGRGFIAKDMGFINTAGAAKHQAVAFRSGSDRSVYYKCSFDAFQDTLYAHSNRQFYRECDITGTIDFIFGNAAVVFQNCNIKPRQPMSNQFNTITAQGKKDQNQNTGIVIQKCTISPLETNMSAPTYLGRPWKQYSTTLFLQSDIGSFVNPQGWKEWISNVDPPPTIFYAEYQNKGPGASVDKRVKWLGYKPSLTDTEVAKFTVESFIQGNEWLPQSKVNFDTKV